MDINKILIQEPLYPKMKLHPWEIELFNTKSLRRLKSLAHYGAGSLVSPINHSRFEHTVGVWKLAAYFFPHDYVLRSAAILHDIGHLPFSHAVEKTLGFDHHQITEKLIFEEEISSILERNGLTSKSIVDFLNKPTPLTGHNDILGLDHLDSFLRDTYMLGTYSIKPGDLLEKLHCSQEGIETDEETGLYLLQLIVADHECFLSPFMIGVDKMLAEAINKHWETTEKEKSVFERYIDAEIIALLKNSPSNEAKNIVNLLLYESQRIQILKGRKDIGLPISIRKVYQKVPLYNGSPLNKNNFKAEILIDKLSSLKSDYEVVY